PTFTQDLFVFAPEAILEPLLAQSIKNHGVLHLLFHPAHFGKDPVPAAMLMAIRRGKEEGLEWWTARQINAWERARRNVRVTQIAGDSVTLEAQDELADATVLMLSSSSDGSFPAWGFKFHSAITTLSAATGSKRIDLE